MTKTLASCKAYSQVSLENERLYACLLVWGFDSHWLYRFRLSVRSRFQKIHFRMCIHLGRWSHNMEECQAILYCGLHYGSRICCCLWSSKEAVWLKKFLSNLGVVRIKQVPITLFCDNSGIVAQSKDPRNHKKGKHIEIKYHIIRDIIACGDVVVAKIESTNNLADPFTKALP